MLHLRFVKRFVIGLKLIVILHNLAVNDTNQSKLKIPSGLVTIFIILVLYNINSMKYYNFI